MAVKPQYAGFVAYLKSRSDGGAGWVAMYLGGLRATLVKYNQFQVVEDMDEVVVEIG